MKTGYLKNAVLTALERKPSPVNCEINSILSRLELTGVDALWATIYLRKLYWYNREEVSGATSNEVSLPVRNFGLIILCDEDIQGVIKSGKETLFTGIGIHALLQAYVNLCLKWVSESKESLDCNEDDLYMVLEHCFNDVPDDNGIAMPLTFSDIKELMLVHGICPWSDDPLPQEVVDQLMVNGDFVELIETNFKRFFNQ